MGVFGLLLGLALLVFGGPIYSAVEWFAELAHSDPYPRSPKNTSEIREGSDTWAWAGFALAAITLPLGNVRFRTWLASRKWGRWVDGNGQKNPDTIPVQLPQVLMRTR